MCRDIQVVIMVSVIALFVWNLINSIWLSEVSDTVKYLEREDIKDFNRNRNGFEAVNKRIDSMCNSGGREK